MLASSLEDSSLMQVPNCTLVTFDSVVIEAAAIVVGKDWQLLSSCMGSPCQRLSSFVINKVSSAPVINHPTLDC